MQAVTNCDGTGQFITVALDASQLLGFRTYFDIMRQRGYRPDHIDHYTLIHSCETHGQAQDAGIQAGDVIIAVDGVQVNNHAEFMEQHRAIKNRPRPKVRSVEDLRRRSWKNPFQLTLYGFR